MTLNIYFYILGLLEIYIYNNNLYYKRVIRFRTRRGSSNRHENNKDKKSLLTLLLGPKFSKAKQINKLSECI